MPLSVDDTDRGRCSTQMRSCLSTAIPPMSPITHCLGNGCGQAGSSTKPGELPLRSTAMPSARRSRTRACCRASVGLLAESCRDGGTEHDAVRQASRVAQNTQLRNFEVIVTPLAHTETSKWVLAYARTTTCAGRAL